VTLSFFTSADFQDFTSQLFGEEFSDYQPIEGAGGDRGLDGVEGKRAFQMYFPDTKNRTDKKFKDKIDDSLVKLEKLLQEGVPFDTWVLVVPVDLRTDVVLYLQTKAHALGIKGIYYGATKLSALAAKHSHVRKAFPQVFLPEYSQEFESVKATLETLHRNQTNSSAILKQSEYFSERKRLQEELLNRVEHVKSLAPNSSAAQTAHYKLQEALKPKIEDLNRRYGESMKLYVIEKEQINTVYDKLISENDSQHAARGVYHSGFRIAKAEEINKERELELQKLDNKFGIVNSEQ
jgi:hypothetical protein